MKVLGQKHLAKCEMPWQSQWIFYSGKYPRKMRKASGSKKRETRFGESHERKAKKWAGDRWRSRRKKKHAYDVWHTTKTKVTTSSPSFFHRFSLPILTAFDGNEAKAKPTTKFANQIWDKSRKIAFGWRVWFRIRRRGCGIMGCMWRGITTWPSCCLAVYSCSLTHYTRPLFLRLSVCPLDLQPLKATNKKLPRSDEY